MSVKRIGVIGGGSADADRLCNILISAFHLFEYAGANSRVYKRSRPCVADPVVDLNFSSIQNLPAIGVIHHFSRHFQFHPMFPSIMHFLLTVVFFLFHSGHL